MVRDVEDAGYCPATRSAAQAALERERAAPAHPFGCNRAWSLSSQGSDRSYGPAIRGDIAYRTNLYLNRAPSVSMSPVVGCGKWIGRTYLPVPAISVRNFRRDRAACA